MVVVPAQRQCPDRRVVTIAGLHAFSDAVVAAAATGWRLWAAHRRPDAVELIFAR